VQASNEDAKDLTQGFFATAIEKRYLDSYDSAKASFQTFLRTCLDRFVTNQRKSEKTPEAGAAASITSRSTLTRRRMNFSWKHSFLK